jgi:hypothetical protein
MEFPRALFSVMRPFCSQGAVLIWDMNLNWAFTISTPTALTVRFNSDCNVSPPHILRDNSTTFTREVTDPLCRKAAHSLSVVIP